MKTFNVTRYTTKGELMEAAYLGDTRALDSALPQPYVDETGIDTWFYVTDYQESYCGKIINLLQKARENGVQIVFHWD